VTSLPVWPRENADWARYFDTYAADYERLSFGSAGLAYVGAREVDVIAAELRSRAPGRVLDAGAGSGRVSRALAQLGWTVTALDVSSEMLRRVGRDVPGSTTVQGALGRPLPFADASFDAIVSVRVLKYVDALEVAIGEFARVLRPGGIAAIEFTNRRSLARFGYRDAPTRLVSMGEAQRLLEDRGLRVVARHTGTRLPQPVWRWARDPARARAAIACERVVAAALGGANRVVGARSAVIVGARV
jgi:ubiquinone/menaquinone biosynthesis C-methylase UbiE